MMSIKIAYINFMLRPYPGIIRKIEGQAGALESLTSGNFDIYILNSVKDEKKGIINYVRYEIKNPPLNHYQSLLNRHGLILKHVPLDKYDVVILRYSKSDPSIIKLLKHSPNLITEHHTNEIYQLKLGIRASFAKAVACGFSLITEKIHEPLFFKNIKGIIGVTDEIRKIELNKAGKNTESVTISNGISVDLVPFTGFKPFDGTSLDMVFMGSTDVPWHGIDRIIKSMNAYTGKVKLRLHCVGDLPKYKGCAKHDIIYHGPVYGKELDGLLSSMNLGVSTLALYKLGLKEACSLKTREYMARGLPFIIAYDDPDLSFAREKDLFFLQFPNNDLFFSMDEIIKYVDSFNKISPKDLSAHMRKYALKYMDWKNKMMQYLIFSEKITR